MRHRVGSLGGDGLQAAVDVVAGPHGAGEEVDRIGQLLFELAQPARRARAGYRDRAHADAKAISSRSSRKSGRQKTEDQESRDRRARR